MILTVSDSRYSELLVLSDDELLDVINAQLEKLARYKRAPRTTQRHGLWCKALEEIRAARMVLNSRL